MNIQDTSSQVLNAPSHATSTQSQCKRHQVRQRKQQVRQPKQQVRQISIYAVLSQIYALFWRTIYRPKNAVAYKKLRRNRWTSESSNFISLLPGHTWNLIICALCNFNPSHNDSFTSLQSCHSLIPHSCMVLHICIGFCLLIIPGTLFDANVVFNYTLHCWVTWLAGRWVGRF